MTNTSHPPYATACLWSGGKDAALALYHTLQNPDYEVKQLLTTCNEAHERVSMHGIREALIRRQAEVIGLPWQAVRLPEEASMEDYNQRMQAVQTHWAEQQISHVLCGDIFLEDLRRYREERFAQQHLQGVFPLWQRDSLDLLEEFWALGFRAKVVCVSARYLDQSFVGRDLDREFVQALPPEVDPCGENGEFHSFVYQAPYFSASIPVVVGEKVYRTYPTPANQTPPAWDTGFWFADLLLG
jgi:uncharacterized protein (TIGR00290 family)